ncbi:uncharacterized protein (TIGR02677 family) [Catenulispora sp. EB89]|uniref:TIGR02677 family protein n=1 Tax=Catenulispora sp. EB89 TaxID=3156257 RepID=UPI003518F034
MAENGLADGAEAGADLDLDGLETATRLRLFGFVRRDDQLLYLWVLRAMDRLRFAHVSQAHTDDVATALAELASQHQDAPAEAENLRQRLDNLAEDGVLHRLEDPARAGKLSAYRNRQSVYQFSELGYLAFRAVSGVLAARIEDANLSRLVFSDILRDFEGLARANRDADADEIVRRLTSLDRVVEDMAQRTARFHLTLGDITRTTDTSPEVFLRHKDALLSHLHNFVVELERYLPRLTSAVAAVEQTGVATLLDRAAMADERPLLGHDRIREDWARRWAALRAWFAIPDAGQSAADAVVAAPPRAVEVRDTAHMAVSAVIALLRQITDAQRSGVNRSTQLKHLAAWVVDTPDEEAAHALMSAAFNLRSARHFGTVHEDEELISSRSTWWDAPGVEISMTLFAKGKAPTPGVPKPVVDKRGSRQHLRSQQAAARAAERDSAARLLDAGVHGRVLDAAELRVLLKLLTRALESRSVVAGRVTASGSNDVLTMRLVPSPGGSAVQTEHGVLHLPGYALELAPLRRRAKAGL